jgi:predicted  nucleic acid-binding Zn-ribbon protein/anti-anti-sigma regulatory factor
LVTARQDEIEVHELALEDPELKEEDFLNQGSGSHFESRVAELVVLIPNPTGLPSLPGKVEQLVAKGFHNIVVGLSGISDLDASGLECLSRSRQVVDTWAGTLRLCEAEGSAGATLGALTGEDAFETFATRGEAIEAYRSSMNDAPLDPGESQDLLAASGDSTAGGDEDANNWGWGSADEVEEPAAPSVDIAEMHVTESELLKLDSELRRVVMGGKRHVSLRLTFSRPLTTDDVDALIGARNYLKREGGLLVLVSLPRDVLKSLRLLDLDKEFAVVEGGGAAEEAHERAAQGLEPVVGGTPAPAVPTTPPVAPAPVAPPAAPAPIAPPPVAASPVGSEIVLEPVSSVELDSGISISESDLGLSDASSAEVERLRADHGAAQAELARLQQEVAGLRNRLGTTQEERDKAHATLNELQTSLRRNERRVAELEQSQGRAERRAAEAEELKNQVREDTRRLDGELTRLRQELDQAREAGQSAQAQLQAAVDPGEVEALKSEVQSRDGRIRELEAQLSKASTSSEGVNLMERCQALEEEKAKILTEAEAEIQRLSNERQTLREELESAGEMIERLGKELELS